jgi:D-beta-D-heptose 7-phosphate kinase/D-beta-D-heptose 1-phosphate adenosyltransferase
MKVVIIGETCIDKFIYGDVKRFSPEAPVPVLTSIKTHTNLGMSGNVVSNVRALYPNSKITHIHQQKNITKTRYVDEKSNHMFLRVDEGEDEVDMIDWNMDMDTILGKADIVIVSDYNKGFLSNYHLQAIAKKSKLSILDTKRRLNQNTYKDFTFIKLNQSEFDNNSDIDHLDVIVTLGAEGAYWNGKIIPQNNPQQTIDVSGAGDTFTSAFITNYFIHKDIENAITFANTIAGKVVTKRGVVTPV